MAKAIAVNANFFSRNWVDDDTGILSKFTRPYNGLCLKENYFHFYLCSVLLLNVLRSNHFLGAFFSFQIFFLYFFGGGQGFRRGCASFVWKKNRKQTLFYYGTYRTGNRHWMVQANIHQLKYNSFIHSFFLYLFHSHFFLSLAAGKV